MVALIDLSIKPYRKIMKKDGNLIVSFIFENCLIYLCKSLIYFESYIKISDNMYFVEKLIQLIREKKSVVCMGLDPRTEQIPKICFSKEQKFMVEDETNKEAILNFNILLIDEVVDLIPVIKPNMAFYEKYDALGVLKETIKYAHKKDLLVILVCKRNDIGSTSEAYADATFKVYGADACT